MKKLQNKNNPKILEKKTTMQQEKSPTKGNTPYSGALAVLFFDGMSNFFEIQKDKVQSVKEWKYTKQNRNTKGSN